MSDRPNPIFAIKPSRSHFEGKIIFALWETKKQDCLYRHLGDTIRMRQEPCVYLRARLLVVPEACFAARPFCPIPGGNHFRPLDPRRPSRRRAFGEYGSALTILPSEPPRVSTGMIYAAAFHIFHCFQVFGSICKIKFVMREHPALPSPAPFSVPRVTPPPRRRHLLLRARESTHMADRSISSHAETPKPDVVRRFLPSTKLSFSFEECQNVPLLDISTFKSRS